MNNRHLPSNDYASLKAGTRTLIKAFAAKKREGAKGRDIDICASYTRVSATMLQDYCDDRKSVFMPIDVQADLESEIGGIITKVQADLIECDLVERRGGKPDDPETLLHHLGDVTRASANLTTDLATALEDGIIDASERNTIRRAALIDIEQTLELVRDLDLAAVANA